MVAVVWNGQELPSRVEEFAYIHSVGFLLDLREPDSSEGFEGDQKKQKHHSGSIQDGFWGSRNEFRCGL